MKNLLFSWGGETKNFKIFLCKKKKSSGKLFSLFCGKSSGKALFPVFFCFFLSFPCGKKKRKTFVCAQPCQFARKIKKTRKKDFVFLFFSLLFPQTNAKQDFKKSLSHKGILVVHSFRRHYCYYDIYISIFLFFLRCAQKR